MAGEGNGNGNGRLLPLWANVLSLVGLPGFIALYVLGVFPFLPVPFYQSISAELRLIEKSMVAHDQNVQELVRLARVKCVRESRTQAEVWECGIRPGEHP